MRGTTENAPAGAPDPFLPPLSPEHRCACKHSAFPSKPFSWVHPLAQGAPALGRAGFADPIQRTGSWAWRPRTVRNIPRLAIAPLLPPARPARLRGTPGAEVRLVPLRGARGPGQGRPHPLGPGAGARTSASAHPPANPQGPSGPASAAASSSPGDTIAELTVQLRRAGRVPRGSGRSGFSPLPAPQDSRDKPAGTAATVGTRDPPAARPPARPPFLPTGPAPTAPPSAGPARKQPGPSGPAPRLPRPSRPTSSPRLFRLSQTRPASSAGLAP